MGKTATLDRDVLDCITEHKRERTVTTLRREMSSPNCFICDEPLQWATADDAGKVTLHRAGKPICCSKQDFPEIGTHYIGMCGDCCDHDPHNK